MFLRIKNKKIDISNIEAIIFDMDGTLVESEHIWAYAKQKIAEAEGTKISTDELEKYIGRGLNDFIDEIIKPENAEHRTLLNQKIQEKALENYKSNINVIDGAIDLLKEFKSVGDYEIFRKQQETQGIVYSMEESKRILENNKKNNEKIDNQRAFKLAKQDEEIQKTNDKFWSKLKLLTNT